ncbi:MAG: NAD(P)-binding domain-containing protein [Polyangiaceae bacterium]
MDRGGERLFKVRCAAPVRRADERERRPRPCWVNSPNATRCRGTSTARPEQSGGPPDAAGRRAPRRRRIRATKRAMSKASDIKTIGLIGSGHIGGTVARLAVDAGYDVVLSNSRGPETLADLVRELGPHARAATAAEAAAAGDIAVVTVPLRAYRSVPVEPLAGKVVIDTNNYYPGRDGQFPELESGSETVSGLLQKHLGTARVVKGFNNIYFKHLLALARPSGAQDRSALPIAGDDAAAKATVAAFLDRIGYDAVDAGSLSESWRFERDMPAYGVPYAGKVSNQGFSDEAKSAPAEVIRAGLAAARRAAS